MARSGTQLANQLIAVHGGSVVKTASHPEPVKDQQNGAS